jgi:hypothetical protein
MVQRPYEVYALLELPCPAKGKVEFPICSYRLKRQDRTPRRFRLMKKVCTLVVLHVEIGCFGVLQEILSF